MVFRPGISGNPGGRRKTDVNVVNLAKHYTPQAIAALVDALKYKNERVHAAAILLDRAWGKVPQPLSGDKNQPLIVDFRWADAQHAQPIASIPVQTKQPKAIDVEWKDVDGN